MAQGGDFSFLNIDVKQCKTTLMNKTIDLPEGGVTSSLQDFILQSDARSHPGSCFSLLSRSLWLSTALPWAQVPLQHIIWTLLGRDGAGGKERKV